MRKFEVYRRVLPSLPSIIFRNIFLLVNGIIFCVVVLLYTFGSIQAAVFLGIVFLLNTLIAMSQDIHARVLLEKLQMLTELRVNVINKDQTRSPVLADEIKRGDLIELKLGDQSPCEGVLTSAESLEISEALVTGESDSFGKKQGDKIIAGAIITSGRGVMEAVGLFRESRLSTIAGEVRGFTSSPSSIQAAINKVIKYSGYILILVLLFVVVRGSMMHMPKIELVNSVGALASMLVPQGLVVVITLLFAIGAAEYSMKNVLFQEINATEKLGRIRNICIDKTGTLTDNILVVEDMHVMAGFAHGYARALTAKCIASLSDSSETIMAVKKYLDGHPDMKEDRQSLEDIETVNSLSFSSWRRYGVVELKESGTLQSVFVGAPDIMVPRVANPIEQKWLENIATENTGKGKRVLCVARASEAGIPQDLKQVHLSVVAIFVFSNTLREGIKEAIKFFQERGIQIRVLSGDNATTVRAVADSVGIKGASSVVTGEELESWSDVEFKNRANEFTVFAQILPEHKVKLVEAFKKDGFTAMVGDGVNDALAMKRADLGIAMFGGVPVTRQLADVVLMTNSFSDLPGAMEVADHFIRSIEINSGVYINMSLVGLLFFIIISFFGYSFPLTPLNITFINYFTVGFSGVLIAYWALRPSGKIPRTDGKPFLPRIMPVVLYSAIVEAVFVAVVFILSQHYEQIASSNALTILAFIISGFLFLLFGANKYSGTLTTKERWQLLLLGIFQVVLIYFVLQIPIVLRFFNITLPFVIKSIF